VFQQYSRVGLAAYFVYKATAAAQQQQVLCSAEQKSKREFDEVLQQELGPREKEEDFS
jgi:hypothetical protein